MARFPQSVTFFAAETVKTTSIRSIGILIAKGIAKAVLLVLLMFTLVALAIQLPPVQTALVKRVSVDLSEKLGFEVKVKNIYINWFNVVYIKHLTVIDKFGTQMIVAEKLNLRFKLKYLIKRHIRVDAASIDGGEVHLVVHKEDESLNINAFIEKLQELTDDGDTTRSPDPSTFRISSVNLRNFSFRYTDQTADTIRDAFDYFHFHLGKLNISANQLRSRRDTFEVNILNAHALESNSGLPIHQLKGFYRYTKRNMFLDNMLVKIGESELKDFLRFDYQTTAAFKNFNKKVKITANLDSSVVNTDDLAWFAPTLKPMHDEWVMSGKFKGTVSNFDVKYLHATTKAGSYLRGNLTMSGLPDVDNTFMLIDLKRTTLQPKDIIFWSGEESALYLNRLGTLKTTSNFTGFTNDFVLKGLFQTPLGNADAYLRLEFPKNKPASYKGHLTSNGFGLGALLGNRSAIQNMAIDAELDGTGFEPEKARLKFKGKIPYIELKGKPIHAIEADMFYNSMKFSGSMAVADTNLHIDFQGFGDLNKKNRFGVIDGQAFNINLQYFGLTSEPSQVKFLLEADVQNLNPAEAQGTIKLQDFEGHIGSRNLKADQVTARSTFEDGQMVFKLTSDFFDFGLKGHFDYAKLVDDLEIFAIQHELLIKNQTADQSKFFAKARRQQKNDTDYTVDFDLQAKKLQSLLDFLSVPVQPDFNTPLEGTFINSSGSFVLEFTTKLRELSLGEYHFFDNTVDLVSSVSKTEPQVLSSINFYSGEQRVPGFPATKSLFSEMQWMNQELNFSMVLNQKSRDNKGTIAGMAQFKPNEVEIELKPTRFRLLNQDWELGKDIRLHIYPNQDMMLEQFLIQSGQQRITASGPISGKPQDQLLVAFHQLESAIFKPFTGADLHGALDANIQITSVLNKPVIQGTIHADSMYLGKVLIGELQATSEFLPATNRLNIAGNVLRDKTVMVRADGYVDLGTASNMNINLWLDNARFQLLEPFLEGLASEMSGLVRGKVVLSGLLKAPKMNGKLFVNSGSFKVDLLQTVYTFSDSVRLTEKIIDVSGARLFDDDRNQATLTTAKLYHSFFQDFSLDVRGSYKRFKVLNTTLADNNLYYGNVIVTGTIDMYGPFNDLMLKANATTNSGTKIYLPFGETESVRVTEDYITFKQKETSATSLRADTVKKVSVSGIKLDFNIDVTDQAYGEIILDKTTGDIIKVVGSGKMKMTFDSKGEFNLLGEYLIKSGQYTFTSFNIFNKNFEIRPGSTIVWSGDPLNGQANIIAKYGLSTSLSPLIPPLGNDVLLQKPEVRRRYPVDVRMLLRGALLSPTITLGIDIIDYPKNSEMATYVTNFQTRIQTDEQELNRQVFSLLVLRSFMGDNAVQGSIQPANSLSEMLSNQLSNWLSTVDQNLEVSVDLTGVNQNSVNSFNVRFSYTLLKGRLRITRDGAIANTQNQTTATAIAGDWTVEYMLTMDGKFRAKMFHRNNLNVITTALNANNTSQGASVMHTQSFNRLSELFEKRRQRKAKKEAKSPAVGVLNSEERQ